MQIVAVIQARTASSRFPGKVLEEIAPGISVAQAVFQRLKKSKLISEIVFAIPEGAGDDPLNFHLMNFGAKVFRGSLHDVQLRYLEAAQTFDADYVVRVTADCPLIDWEIVDQVIDTVLADDLDYCSNVTPPTFPDGLDVEVFRLSALHLSRSLNGDEFSKEHVTTHLQSSDLFRKANVTFSEDFSALRWTVDYPQDLAALRSGLESNFLEMNWTYFIESDFSKNDNRQIVRNDGMQKNSGQKVYTRAKQVIPGGTMLLSKRPEMFLPEQWPSYYSRAKGIQVTDLDGRNYLDFATMSVGACSLGYGNEAVDAAVISAVHDGVMSTLNSPGEVQLAELLVSLHPWSEMVRLARTGGEANAVAVRIARAHTAKSKVAICGYHGWHDWYLSANLSENSNLDGHLLPGLDPAGVPRELLGTTIPFAYNDARSLENLLKTGEFAAVQMEVSRNFGPDAGFLESVREICDKYGAVLIFDECTSGFRETFGGLHLKFGVEPDIAMFGKALGNGYAITAVLGRRKVMESAQATFISSTFWTERLGPVAAIATLGEMQRQRSWEVLPETGRKVQKIWSDKLQELGFNFRISGIDALPSFVIEVPQWQTLKSLFIQEMLDQNFLAATTFYSSTAYDDESVEAYKVAFGRAMNVVANHVDEHSAKKRLRGPVGHAGFARIN